MPPKGIIERIDEGIDFNRMEQAYEIVGCKSKTCKPNRHDCNGCVLYWFERDWDAKSGKEVQRGATDTVVHIRGSEPGTPHCKLEEYAKYRKELIKLL